MENHPVAIIIPNYNMPERVDALAEFFKRTARHPYDLIVVDDASNSFPPSRFTTVQLRKNLGPNGAWWAGFSYADRLERERGVPFFAYLLCVTSARIPEKQKDKDLVSPMVQKLLEDEAAVVIHPAHTPDSETPWRHMIDSGSGGLHRIGYLEYICGLFRASWLNEIGRMDPAYRYNWGTEIDICLQARRSNRTIWLHEGILITKDQDLGYKTGRYGMTQKEHAKKAIEEMETFLQKKYGRESGQLISELMFPEEKSVLMLFRLTVRRLKSFLRKLIK